MCSTPVHDAVPGFTLEDNLVCTVGSASIWPGASNVIPGSANFTVDIRCRSDGVREAVVGDVTAAISALCARWHTPTSSYAGPNQCLPCSNICQQLLMRRVQSVIHLEVGVLRCNIR